MHVTTVEMLRGPKVFDMSVFDWVCSVSACFLIGHFVFCIDSLFDWIVLLMLWNVFGIFVHYIFEVKTKSGFYLGLNDDPRP